MSAVRIGIVGVAGRMGQAITREIAASNGAAVVAGGIEQPGNVRVPDTREQINDAWYNRVHGQNPSTFFGIYDVVRWDNVWVAQA